MSPSKPKAPRAEPLGLAPGYRPEGTKRKPLGWSFAEQRLRRAHNYWVCSTRPSGRPHAAPVWGLWVDGAFYFSTDPGSRKARNLSELAEVVVHLESGDEVVIVEGKVRPCPLTAELDRAYQRKYGMHLIGFPAPMVMLRVAPKLVMAWREKSFAASATRYRLD